MLGSKLVATKPPTVNEQVAVGAAGAKLHERFTALVGKVPAVVAVKVDAAEVALGPMVMLAGVESERSMTCSVAVPDVRFKLSGSFTPPVPCTWKV